MFLGVDISETSVAHLLATSSNHHYVKCVDICPQPEPDILLAVGQANGKVVLTTFGQTAFDSLGLAGLELGIYVYIYLFYLNNNLYVVCTYFTNTLLY